MTAFVIVCAAMLAAALLWVTLPLLRPKSAEDAAQTRSERQASTVVIALFVPVIAAAMYAGLSNWDWKAAQTAAENQANVEQMLQQLQAKLKQNPQDEKGWLLLGRSYAALERFAPAVDAYQHAYDLTQGEDVDAIVGLGEALVMVDQKELTGRAGKLFDAALEKQPTNPKALWYASVAALQAGDLKLGRDRLQMLLAQNPPEELRGVLLRQIEDLTQQIGDGAEGAAANAPSGAATAQAQPGEKRVIRASVSIDPKIQQQLREPIALFVLARDPSAGGPPLAVQRRISTDAPLTLELSERDAMLPSHTIASVPRVQVVARLSRSGAPQAASGDFYGEADYDFSKDTGTLHIVIDRTVP
ncbi:MAG TPA: hypothetical protein VNQ81_14050 [Povalibacter sp.]|nr:hypothetical protein [Povalibacter sp.]